MTFQKSWDFCSHLQKWGPKLLAFHQLQWEIKFSFFFIYFILFENNYFPTLRRHKFLQINLVIKNSIFNRGDPPEKKESFRKSDICFEVCEISLLILMTCHYFHQLLWNNFVKWGGKGTLHFHLVKEEVFYRRFLHLNKENVRNYAGQYNLRIYKSCFTTKLPCFYCKLCFFRRIAR